MVSATLHSFLTSYGILDPTIGWSLQPWLSPTIASPADSSLFVNSRCWRALPCLTHPVSVSRSSPFQKSSLTLVSCCVALPANERMLKCSEEHESVIQRLGLFKEVFVFALTLIRWGGTLPLWCHPHRSLLWQWPMSPYPWKCSAPLSCSYAQRTSLFLFYTACLTCRAGTHPCRQLSGPAVMPQPCDPAGALIPPHCFPGCVPVCTCMLDGGCLLPPSSWCLLFSSPCTLTFLKHVKFHTGLGFKKKI